MRPSLIDRGLPHRRSARAARWIRRIGALLLWQSLSAAPRSASAQDESSFEVLIQEGIRLRRQGRDEAALEVFQRAERLQPSSVRVLLHLATAAQAAGRWVQAESYIHRVFEHRDDPYYRRYQSDIGMVEQIIASRVGRLQVEGEPAGAEVRLNGKLVGHVPMQEPERLEAGNYQLEVVASGHYALRRALPIPGGVLTREVIQLDRRRGPSNVALPSPADPGDQAWWAEPWVGWSLAGLSAASALTSAVAFTVREQEAADWNDDSRCVVPGAGTREQQCGSDYGDARLAERIGVTAGIGAIVFGGAAAWHFLTARTSAEAPPAEAVPAGAGLRLSTCAPGFMGIACEGTF